VPQVCRRICIGVFLRSEKNPSIGVCLGKGQVQAGCALSVGGLTEERRGLLRGPGTDLGRCLPAAVGPQAPGWAWADDRPGLPLSCRKKKREGAAASCSTTSSGELCKRQGAPEISWVRRPWRQGGNPVPCTYGVGMRNVALGGRRW